VAVNKYYQVSGDSIKSRKPVCPRCGNGVFLAEHAERMSCGKCGYTEFKIISATSIWCRFGSI
jgi:small subunit ribosomal protein S27Ae